MKIRKFIIIFLVTVGFLMLFLGANNAKEETVINEDPIEIEGWMTQPFVVT